MDFAYVIYIILKIKMDFVKIVITHVKNVPVLYKINVQVVQVIHLFFKIQLLILLIKNEYF